MFLVGLTGGIASGKSSVIQVFQQLGCAVIDVDVIARHGELGPLGSIVGLCLLRVIGSSLPRRLLSVLQPPQESSHPKLSSVTALRQPVCSTLFILAPNQGNCLGFPHQLAPLVTGQGWGLLDSWRLWNDPTSS